MSTEPESLYEVRVYVNKDDTMPRGVVAVRHGPGRDITVFVHPLDEGLAKEQLDGLDLNVRGTEVARTNAVAGAIFPLKPKPAHWRTLTPPEEAN